MQDRDNLQTFIKDLFNSQQLAVLSTQTSAYPYSSLIAFAAIEDLTAIIFATTRATRKYSNLLNNTNVSLLIDNRSNQPSDFHKASAVTAIGRAEEIKDHERGKLKNIYLAKHPQLKDFISSPSCALFKVQVDTYLVVYRFQNVQELHIIK